MKKQVYLIIIVLAAAAASGDLVGYWAFEEGSGVATADSSGNSQDAVFFAADGSNYPTWTTGKIGSGAIEFNTSTTGFSNSNHLVVDANSFPSHDPNIPGLGNLTDVFTIAMWIRRDALYVNLSADDIPRLINTGAYGIQLALDPSSGGNDPYDFFLWTGATNNKINIGESTAEQDIGNWYHLAVTADGQTIRKYINGIEEYSTGLPEADMQALFTDFTIAATATNKANFIGALDDVAVWAGTYLPGSEVVKLADETATPLTVVDEKPEHQFPPDFFTKETELAWTSNGWKLLWSRSFEWDVYINSDNTAEAWWFPGGREGTKLLPGARTSCWDMNKWFIKELTSGTYSHPAQDIDTYGIEWIHPSWSGMEPNSIAVFAPYITSGIALCQMDKGYERFVSYNDGWRKKDYFKTYARVAAINNDGAELCVRSYSTTDANSPPEPNSLTLLGDVYLPLPVDDYVWKELKFAYPKPKDNSSTTRVWTEVSFVGGNEDTVVYIDEFNPISDQANTSQHTATYKTGDINKDSIVNREDLLTIVTTWLDSGSITEPRDTGMLANGDFFEDIDRFGTNEWISVDPKEWTFTGTGDTGILRTGDIGLMNSYMLNTPAPIGGSVSAYLTTEDAVLSQTTIENAVEGLTYYAMAYVMTNDWNGWKDIATMSLEIDDVEVASFSRPMSLLRWRPVYGTYTATASDTGKPITVNLYASEAMKYAIEGGHMYTGYVYLDTVMPEEWPDGRDNLLINGGFEDLSALDPNIPPGTAAIADGIRVSDNWGGWFIDNVPAPPGWMFEVSTGFSLDNEGGIFASGQMGAPIPTPGMNDVSVYTSEDLILGQIIGGLSNGTTYYLDMACGVNIEPTVWGSYDAAWPNPAPQFHLELWQIPSGVTNPDTIHTGITTSQAGYVKIAEAMEDAIGDIKGGGATPPASRWQLIGTTYTATSADTNVYIRVYGTNSVAVPHPSFAFSDVYISTEKRLVPGGDVTFEIEPELQYDIAGPYTCYHANLMGLEATPADLDGNCLVNLNDFVFFAEGWLENWYTNITGTAPWE